MQDAQRDLESGKTLPPFLIQQDATLLLTAGEHTVAIPEGFIREVDDELPHYVVNERIVPQFLQRKRYQDAVVANMRAERAGPKIYVVRRGVLDFINVADRSYTLIWSYYKKAVVLDSNVENVWLRDAAEWLIGESGWRIAQDLRDQAAAQIFDGIRTRGRAAVFGEIVAAEESAGPVAMGEDS
jgi:hypothetical protein